MKTIENLSHCESLNHDVLHTIPQLSRRLDAVDVLVRLLVAQTQVQSLQIDTYLDSYENMVKLLTEFSVKQIRNPLS